MSFLKVAFRYLFFAIDKIVFGLIDDVYGLLLQLSRTTIFSTDAIHSFAQRIYAFIGIFMLFKVSVSLVNYVLNPDAFSDKEKGFSSVLKNVLLSLVMIVLVPYVFEEAYSLQSIILEENTIMNVIFGSPTSNDGQLPNSSYAEAAGQKIQFTIMYAFAQPNYEEFATGSNGLISCRDTYVTDANGNFKFRSLPVYGENGGNTSNSRFIYELNPGCFGKYNPESDLYEDGGSNAQLLKLFENNDSGDIYQDYAQGVAQQSFSLFFKQDIMLAKESADDGRFLINYRYFISTVVGIAVLYLFVLFCIDIAARSIKLGFLQMIAPIPIISYCDPKSGKDGMFKKWLDMCVHTYLELFIRLAALYFGIYVITLIGTFRDVTTNEVVSGFFVSVFMIVGVLIFVKKLPDILKEMFNMKGNGKFTLNPLKKIEEEAIGGKRITGFGAGLVGGAVGALTGAGIGRVISGGLSGAKNGKGWSETWRGTKDKNAKYRTANLVDRNPFRRSFGRFTQDASDLVGTGGKLAQIEREEAKINREIDRFKSKKEEIENEIAPTKTIISRNQNTMDKIKGMQDRAVSKVKQGTGTAGAIYQAMKQNAEGIKNSSRSSGSVTVNGKTYSWTDDIGRGAAAVKLEQDAEAYANSDGRDSYIDQAMSHGGFDKQFDNLRTDYITSAAASGLSAEKNAADLDKQSTRIGNSITSDRASISAKETAIQNLDDEIKNKNEELHKKNEEKKRYESYRVK